MYVLPSSMRLLEDLDLIQQWRDPAGEEWEWRDVQGWNTEEDTKELKIENLEACISHNEKKNNYQVLMTVFGDYSLHCLSYLLI